MKKQPYIELIDYTFDIRHTNYLKAIYEKSQSDDTTVIQRVKAKEAL